MKKEAFVLFTHFSLHIHFYNSNFSTKIIQLGLCVGVKDGRVRQRSSVCICIGLGLLE